MQKESVAWDGIRCCFLGGVFRAFWTAVVDLGVGGLVFS